MVGAPQKTEVVGLSSDSQYSLVWWVHLRRQRLLDYPLYCDIIISEYGLIRKYIRLLMCWITELHYSKHNNNNIYNYILIIFTHP